MGFAAAPTGAVPSFRRPLAHTGYSTVPRSHRPVECALDACGALSRGSDLARWLAGDREPAAAAAASTCPMPAHHADRPRGVPHFAAPFPPRKPTALSNHIDARADRARVYGVLPQRTLTFSATPSRAHLIALAPRASCVRQAVRQQRAVHSRAAVHGGPPVPLGSATPSQQGGPAPWSRRHSPPVSATPPPPSASRGHRREPAK